MSTTSEGGIARAIAFIALLFIALVLMSCVLIVIEAFVRSPSAAEWAQALGGILAVAAAAWIAGAESRRSRQQLAVQIDLQNELMQHNQSLIDESRLRERDGSIASLRAAYGIVAIVADALDRSGNVTDLFVETWISNFASARRWLSHVNIKDMRGTSEMSALAQFHTDIDDLEVLLKKAASQKEDKELCAFFTGMFRTKLMRMKEFVEALDGKWATGLSEDALKLSDFERAQMISGDVEDAEPGAA